VNRGNSRLNESIMTNRHCSIPLRASGNWGVYSTLHLYSRRRSHILFGIETHIILCLPR
jgi:hypothetical protein